MLLQIGCPRGKILRDAIDGQTIDGVTFQVVKVEGLNSYVSHNAPSDSDAKRIVKKVISSNEDLKATFTSIMVVDENGRLV